MLCKLPEWTTLGNYFFFILNKDVYLSIDVIFMLDKCIDHGKLFGR